MPQISIPFHWESLHRELVRFVSGKVKDTATAKDIVQDVFVKVHSKRGQLREADKVTGWIYQITRNAIADHFRNNHKNISVADLDWESDDHDFNDCVAGCLKELMATLPDIYRIPLQLTEIENLSQYEVAERLNITYSGARSRVQRARKLLKDKLNELYVVETDAYGNVIVCEDRLPCACQAAHEVTK